jgi:hypothetical protein
MNEWVTLTGGTGSLRIRVSYRPNQVSLPVKLY